MAGHEPGASQGVTSGASHCAPSLRASRRRRCGALARPPRDLLKATRSAGGGPRRRRRTNASGRLGRFGQKPGCGHLQACFRRPLPHAAWQRRVNASAGEGTEQGHCRCGCGSKRCRGPLRSAGVQQTAKARTRGAMVSPRLRVQLAPPWWRERWQDFLTTDDSLLQSGTAQKTARNQPGVEAFS
jgi:hypothetical protein